MNRKPCSIYSSIASLRLPTQSSSLEEKVSARERFFLWVVYDFWLSSFEVLQLVIRFKACSNDP